MERFFPYKRYAIVNEINEPRNRLSLTVLGALIVSCNRHIISLKLCPSRYTRADEACQRIIESGADRWAFTKNLVSRVIGADSLDSLDLSWYPKEKSQSSFYDREEKRKREKQYRRYFTYTAAGSPDGRTSCRRKGRQVFRSRRAARHSGRIL